jgi:hypothetical protein
VCSVLPFGKQGQIGSLKLSVGRVSVTTSLVEMCQAVWTLLDADRQRERHDEENRTCIFVEMYFLTNTQTWWFIYKVVVFMYNEDAN